MPSELRKTCRKLLANLNSADPSIREEAHTELFGNICHQGTVYPATVKAFPELIALLKSPECIDQNSVALLVASIADGDGNEHVHSFPEFQDFCRETLTHTGATLGEELEREQNSSA